MVCSWINYNYYYYSIASLSVLDTISRGNLSNSPPKSICNSGRVYKSYLPYYYHVMLIALHNVRTYSAITKSSVITFNMNCHDHGLRPHISGICTLKFVLIYGNLFQKNDHDILCGGVIIYELIFFLAFSFH